MGNNKQTAEAQHSSQPSASSTKEALTALSELVEFDHEPAMGQIQDDIEHGVAHPVSGMSELEERVNDLDSTWETDSLLADMLDDLTDETVTNGKPPLGRVREDTSLLIASANISSSVSCEMMVLNVISRPRLLYTRRGRHLPPAASHTGPRDAHRSHRWGWRYQREEASHCLQRPPSRLPRGTAR